MNNHSQNSLIKSFVSCVKNDLKKSLLPYSKQIKRKVKSVDRSKGKLTLEPLYIQKTISIQQASKIQLPICRQQKRRSFIDDYQENIIKKSLNKGSQNRNKSILIQQQKHKIIRRKSLLQKSRFRIEGLATSIKNKKQQFQLWQQKQKKNAVLCKTCTQQIIIDTINSYDYIGKLCRLQKIKRSLTSDKFIVEPWEQNF